MPGIFRQFDGLFTIHAPRWGRISSSRPMICRDFVEKDVSIPGSAFLTLKSARFSPNQRQVRVSPSRNHHAFALVSISISAVSGRVSLPAGVSLVPTRLSVG